MLSSLYRCCRCHRPMACGSKRIENNSRQIRAMTAPTSQSDRHHRFNHPFHTSIIATNNVNKEHRNNKHINHSNTINPSMIRVVLRPSTTHAASSIEYYRISPIEYRQYHWISSKTQTTITQTHTHTSHYNASMGGKEQSQRLVIYRFFLLAQTHKKHRTDIDTKINTYILHHSIIMVPQRPPQHIHQAINQNAIIQHANNPQSIVPTNARHNRTHDNHRFNHPFHTSIIATNNMEEQWRQNFRHILLWIENHTLPVPSNRRHQWINMVCTQRCNEPSFSSRFTRLFSSIVSGDKSPQSHFRISMCEWRHTKQRRKLKENVCFIKRYFKDKKYGEKKEQGCQVEIKNHGYIW